MRHKVTIGSVLSAYVSNPSTNLKECEPQPITDTIGGYAKIVIYDQPESEAGKFVIILTNNNEGEGSAEIGTLYCISAARSEHELYTGRIPRFIRHTVSAI